MCQVVSKSCRTMVTPSQGLRPRKAKRSLPPSHPSTNLNLLCSGYKLKASVSSSASPAFSVVQRPRAKVNTGSASRAKHTLEPSLSKSVPASTVIPTIPVPPRASPRSPLISGTFAASKCFEPPTPHALPKPPVTWFQTDHSKIKVSKFDPDEISSSLMMMLKVQG